MKNQTDKAWYALCDKWESQGYESLTTHEKVWLNTRSLIDSIENCGLISYFSNSGANNYADMLTALLELYAFRTIELVKAVASLFSSDLSSDIEERNKQIEAWPESQAREDLLDDIDNELMPLMKNLEAALQNYIDENTLNT